MTFRASYDQMKERRDDPKFIDACKTLEAYSERKSISSNRDAVQCDHNETVSPSPEGPRSRFFCSLQSPPCFGYEGVR